MHLGFLILLIPFDLGYYWPRIDITSCHFEFTLPWIYGCVIWLPLPFCQILRKFFDWECCWLVIGRVLQLLASLIVLLELAHFYQQNHILFHIATSCSKMHSDTWTQVEVFLFHLLVGWLQYGNISLNTVQKHPFCLFVSPHTILGKPSVVLLVNLFQQSSTEISLPCA